MKLFWGLFLGCAFLGAFAQGAQTVTCVAYVDNGGFNVDVFGNLTPQTVNCSDGQTPSSFKVSANSEQAFISLITQQGYRFINAVFEPVPDSSVIFEQGYYFQKP